MIEKLKWDNGFWIDETGCSYQTKGDYLQGEFLGLCGCGNPEEVMDYVRELLEKIDQRKWGEYEDMPYMFFVYWANQKDFAEHGTTEMFLADEQGQRITG